MKTVICAIILVMACSLSYAKELPERPSEKKKLAYQIVNTGNTSGYTEEQVQQLLKYLPPGKRRIVDQLYHRGIRPFHIVSEAEEAEIRAKNAENKAGVGERFDAVVRKADAVVDQKTAEVAERYGIDHRIIKIGLAIIGALIVILLIKKILFR